MNRRELIKYSVASIPALSLSSYNVLANIAKPDCDFSYENVKRQLKNHDLDRWQLINIDKAKTYKILGGYYESVISIYCDVNNDDSTYSRFRMIKVNNTDSLISCIKVWEEGFSKIGYYNYKLYMCDKHEGYFAPVGFNLFNEK
jgi:hypothetical protein